MFAVGSLLAVLSLLTGGTAAMGTSDVFLLLGLGLHLALVRVVTLTATTEEYPILQNLLEVFFTYHKR